MLLVQVDAFTFQPFRGNPAAVCFLDGQRPDAWLQSVAAEMNLSETAFLLPLETEWSLRWFTPATEVALCGHATLASAHALWEENRLESGSQARFHTKSGLLTADRRGTLIELDFPATRAERCAPPPGLLEALGVTAPAAIARSRFDYLVEVESEEVVRSLEPHQGELRKIPVRGVIVTSPGTGEYDFVSRFIAPGSGVDEDPVTGSAHCCLAPWWAGRIGKSEMTAYQASARGGVVRVRLEGDRVKLGGGAVTTLRGTLVV
jgi:PhzF family phenazine biosynthesis protein